jgi:hypothetical protein
MIKNRYVLYFRRSLLALFVVLITAAAYLHQVGGERKDPLHPRPVPLRRAGKPLFPTDRRHPHRQDLFRDRDPLPLLGVLAWPYPREK